MELPPPLPSPSPPASSAPAPVLETSEDVSSPAIWDWGDLLDFSIDADDSLILQWDTPDLRLPHRLSPQPPLSELASPADPVPAILPVGGSSSRVRKRDPRLVCANYLAGRVPCACPELDELELEKDEEEPILGGRKRSKLGVVSVGMRCQVRGCEADIRELKGYNRRHRVCLQCANASSVMLDGEEKRYCQQCGKFHVLHDFDEDKRSCRQKLERHNRRRRRKLTDSNGVQKENLSQGELLEDVFLDTDQTRGYEETLQGSACEAVVSRASNKVMDGEITLDCDNRNDYPACSFSGLEQAQTNSPLSFAASTGAPIDDRTNNSKSTFSTTICDKKTSYSSTCPTGRISFKLYDWNPAEFPRRLRHQIFQWLANMPVELEGYIRPGCTILTVFIAMPQYMWEKLSQDGTLYVNQLINSPESLFFGKDNILIYLSNIIVHVLKDGTSVTEMESQCPSLHYVHPTYFEAGKVVEFTACGSNLDQPKLRFLVSFAGKYLVCDAYRVISHQNVRCDGGNSVTSNNNCGHEMFRINVKHTNPDDFGPAFIEVENESGISNFIPILIGNKQICSELEKLRGALTHHPNVHEDNNVSSAVFPNTVFNQADMARQIDMSDLLMDIAWLLKGPCNECNRSSFSLLNVRRLTYILQFSLRNELISVLKAILKYVSIMIDRVNFHSVEKLTVRADLVQLLEYMETATEFLNQRTEHEETGKQESLHLFMEALPVDLVINDMNIMTHTNLVVDRRNASALPSASTSQSVDSDEIASLLSKDTTCSKISLLRSGSSHWPSKYWPTIMLSPITRRWSATLAICTSIMCFLVCIIFYDAHKTSDFVVYMGRYAHEAQTGR